MNLNTQFKFNSSLESNDKDVINLVQLCCGWSGYRKKDKQIENVNNYEVNALNLSDINAHCVLSRGNNTAN